MMSVIVIKEKSSLPSIVGCHKKDMLMYSVAVVTSQQFELHDRYLYFENIKR